MIEIVSAPDVLNQVVIVVIGLITHCKNLMCVFECSRFDTEIPLFQQKKKEKSQHYLRILPQL